MSSASNISLGNIGGIEKPRIIVPRDLAGLAAAVDHLDRGSVNSFKETRLAIEKIRGELGRLEGLIQATVGPAGPPGPPGTPGADAGNQLPDTQNIPFPFVVTASIVVPPNGIGIFSSAVGYRITKCELHCDPEAAAATADTTFLLQNAVGSPTATAGVTILSGSRIGFNYSMNLPIAAGQRLYVKAPSSLNGVMNLWLLLIERAKL